MSKQSEIQECTEAVYRLLDQIKALREGAPLEAAPKAAEVGEATSPSVRERLLGGMQLDEAADLFGRTLGIYPEIGEPSEQQSNAAYNCLNALERENLLSYYEDEGKRPFIRWNME